MDKLIITCAINDHVFWAGRGVNMPTTPQEVVDAARDAANAGAAIVHFHIAEYKDFKGPPYFNIKGWVEIVSLIRQQCDVLLEHGTGGLPYLFCENYIPDVPEEVRKNRFDIKMEHPDLIATHVGDLHHPFGSPRGIYVMPTRDNYREWRKILKEGGVKPSFEEWHIGQHYNLQWMIDNDLVDPPYFITLFFGAESSVGSPATIDEMLHRVNALPKGCVWQPTTYVVPRGIATVSQQIMLSAHAIALGGHVRVGLEDCPYYWDGVPAKDNAQVVERIVRLARDLGREVATPDEARQMLGLPPHKK